MDTLTGSLFGNLPVAYMARRKGRVPFSAYCIGGRDWSLKNFYSQQDAAQDPELVEDLKIALGAIDAKRVFAFTPGFNAEPIDREELMASTKIYVGVPPYWDIPIYRKRSSPSDITNLVEKGDTAILSAGGCPSVVLVHEDTDTLFIGHAGRESAMDRESIQTDGHRKGRQRESVVHVMLDMLSKRDGNVAMSSVHAWILWSIPPKDFDHPFDHPKHGAWNYKAAKHVRDLYGTDAVEVVNNETALLDLPAILYEQLSQAGVPVQNIHRDNAYLPDAFPTTRNGNKGRYLFVVTRH